MDKAIKFTAAAHPPTTAHLPVTAFTVYNTAAEKTLKTNAFITAAAFFTALRNAASRVFGRLRFIRTRTEANAVNERQNEEELIKSSQNGDGDAFERLIKPYERLAYNIAYSKVSNAEDAADVTQEIFIKVWRSLSGFRGESSFSTWLSRVAVNTALDYIRKNRKSAVVSLTVDDDERSESDIADTSPDVSPETAAERSEVANAVRSAIAKLSDDARTVIVLRDMEGYTYAEIADITGLELGTVKSRINRARAQIKEILASDSVVIFKK